MTKQGVSKISGNPAPKVGEKTTYMVTDWYPATPAGERNPASVTWELFKKRPDGSFTTTNIKKTGDGSFTFGEVAAKNTYRLEAYLHEPEGSGPTTIDITPQPAGIPKINKVELRYVDDSPGTVFSYTEKMVALAHCVNLTGEKLLFTLWEDDAAGEGHNSKNKFVDSKQAVVGRTGTATAEFILTKALMQKAAQGERDPKELEFYVTVEYYKDKKHASDNKVLKNPDYKPPVHQPAPSAPAKGSTPAAVPKAPPKAPGSPAASKPASQKEESGIIDAITESVRNKWNELWDWAESKGTVKPDKKATSPKPDGKTTSVVNGQEVKSINCGEKYCIKKGDKNELIREINIRLAGFGGNVPTDEFTDRTEKMVKQFQRDYMKVPETGKVCGNVLKAIDEFQNKYLVNFDDVKCPCGKCKGFGNGKFSEQKQNLKVAELSRKYEYPGIHRSLVWALRAAIFYTSVIEKDMKYSVKCIFSGYRCHENNKQHKRTSTNHMGKALDIHFNKNGKRTQVPKEIEEVRQKIFVKHLGNQVRWKDSNKFSLEPGIPAYKGEFIASTWIHYDVRQFELKYLKDEFFVKDINAVNGTSIVELALKTNKETCRCMGGGTTKQINPPANIPKSQGNNFTENDAKEALKIIYDKHGKDMAVIIEKMYRDETRHFQSGQFKACGTGGMEAFGSAPYYGWDKNFFEANPEFKPVGIWSAFENKGMSGQGGNKQVTDRKKEFVVFPSVLAGMEFKVFYINKYNGNWARWHSTDKSVQEVYKKHIQSIRARFVNDFEKSK